MPTGLDLDALAHAVAALPSYAGVTRADLVPLRVKGLAHDHVSLKGRGVLLRVPKQSQFGLSARRNFEYQAACFKRAGASGRTPRLHAAIPPDVRIPMGAFLVDEIAGRPPRLPEDLRALAECMARVHALPVPPAADRPPLSDHRDPVAGAMAEVERQAAFLDEAELAPAARAEIEDELAWVRAFRAEAAGRAQPVTLVLTDTHPGNFLIDAAGHAIAVDLEKALYGSPGTDLAHCTIYSSTTWDPDTCADLSLNEVAGFYRHYLAALDPALAEVLRPWLVPMRRITMARAITWCVKWQVLHRREAVAGKHAAASTEDWSAENTDPALIAHVNGRVADYLSPGTLRRMRAEWLGRPGLDASIGTRRPE
jgi:aminoglycoside phosphotransferase (APT) family kinase protein